MRLGQRGQFRGARSCLDAARAAVITYMIIVNNRRVVVDDSRIVDDHIMRVDIVHHVNVDPVHRAVVVEGSMIPVAALITNTRVAEPVIDSSIEADMRTPIAVKVCIVIVRVTPVARRP